MTAGMHSVGQTTSGKAGKYALLVGGHVVALIVGAFAFQMLRPPSAFPDQPGRGTVPSSDDEGSTKRFAGRVNGELIGWDVVAAEAMNRHGPEILDNLINRKIIEQECTKRGIQVSTEEVRLEVGRISKKFNLSVEQWLAMLMSERKVTEAQYYQDIIWPMLALKKLAGSQIKLTNDDIEKAWVRNYGERVKGRIIVLDNSRRAAEVWNKARANPESFERLVFEYSVDPSSRPLGGSIPPIRRYSGSPEVEEAAFKLKEGEISGVIQVSTNQWVIMKCEGRTEPVAVEKQDVLPALKEELIEERTQESVAKVFEQLKASARVDNYLTNTTKGGEKKVSSRAGTAAAGVQPAGASSGAGRPGVSPAGGAQAAARAAAPRVPATK